VLNKSEPILFETTNRLLRAVFSAASDRDTRNGTTVGNSNFFVEGVVESSETSQKTIRTATPLKLKTLNLTQNPSDGLELKKEEEQEKERGE
jgi:hypothetical protein